MSERKSNLVPVSAYDQPSGEPRPVLDYCHSHSARTAGPWIVLALGGVPFFIEVIAIFFEAITGDPPNNLSEFKAYHYMTAIASFIALCWLPLVWRAFRDRHQLWVTMVATGWCAWVLWVGLWFLRELNRHPAAAYYWSLWKE